MHLLPKLTFFVFVFLIGCNFFAVTKKGIKILKNEPKLTSLAPHVTEIIKS